MASTSDTGGVAGADPAELGEHREALLRFALLQLRDRAAAEDAVQATFVAALQSGSSFKGESTLRTWLIGILKRKIMDHFRGQVRAGEALDGMVAAAGEDDDPVDRLFASNGGWVTPPRDWSDPHRSLEDDVFWRIFEACLEALPGLTGRIFLLREVMGIEPDEICKDFGISRSNYWVLMHRARLRLRGCLETRWFGKDAGP